MDNLDALLHAAAPRPLDSPDMAELVARGRRRRRRRRVVATAAVAALVVGAATALVTALPDRGPDVVLAPGPDAPTSATAVVPTESTLPEPRVDRLEITELDPAPLSPRLPVVAWTGEEVLLWGGVRSDLAPVVDGARRSLDPGDSWVTLAPAPFSDLIASIGVWTGRELWIVGTADAAPGSRAVAAAYDPATDVWRSLPEPPGSGTELLFDRLVWLGDAAALVSLEEGPDVWLLAEGGTAWEPLFVPATGTPTAALGGDGAVVLTGSEQAVALVAGPDGPRQLAVPDGDPVVDAAWDGSRLVLLRQGEELQTEVLDAEGAVLQRAGPPPVRPLGARTLVAVDEGLVVAVIDPGIEGVSASVTALDPAAGWVTVAELPLAAPGSTRPGIRVLEGEGGALLVIPLVEETGPAPLILRATAPAGELPVTDSPATTPAPSVAAEPSTAGDVDLIVALGEAVGATMLGDRGSAGISPDGAPVDVNEQITLGLPDGTQLAVTVDTDGDAQAYLDALEYEASDAEELKRLPLPDGTQVLGFVRAGNRQGIAVRPDGVALIVDVEAGEPDAARIAELTAELSFAVPPR